MNPTQIIAGKTALIMLMLLLLGDVIRALHEKQTTTGRAMSIILGSIRVFILIELWGVFL